MASTAQLDAAIAKRAKLAKIDSLLGQTQQGATVGTSQSQGISDLSSRISAASQTETAQQRGERLVGSALNLQQPQQQVAPIGQESGIALPPGMTMQDIEQRREQALRESIGPGEQQFQQRLAAGQATGRFTTPEQDPLGAGRPMRFPFERVGAAISGEFAETEETKRLPRLGQLNIALGTDLKRSAALITASSPEERVQMIQALVPGTTFRFDEKGNIIGRFPDGREGVLNKPGFTTTDALKFVSELAKFTPATRVAGGISAGLGTGVAGRIGAQAVGAAATSTASEAASAALGGEFQPSEIAIETGLAGAGEAIGEGISAIRRQRALRPGTEAAEAADLAAAGREAGEETGIELFKAQETLVQSQLERQSFVAQLPAGSQIAIKGLRRQNEQAADAVTDFLNSIAPADVVENAAVKFRTVSQRAVEFKNAIRKEFTSPLYKEAFAENPPVNLDPVREIIESARTRFPDKSGKFKKSLDEVTNLISGKEEIIPGSPILDAKGNPIVRESKKQVDPTLEQLHGAKVLIDDMIARSGEDSVGRTAKGILKRTQSALLRQMDESSEAYTLARRRFAQETPAVQQTTEGVLGRIAKLDDPQLKNISKTIFDSAETNPQVLSRIRRTIENQDPDAWNDLLRVEMQRRMLGAKADLLESATETVENIPGQLLRALKLNTEGSFRVVMNSLNRDQRKNLSFLRTALGRAKLGRVTGSQTAGREEIKTELREGIANAIGAFFQPSKTASEAFRGATFDRRTKAMAEAFFDPRWTERVAEIRKMKIGSVKASRAMSQLLNEIETESLSPTDQPEEETK